MGRLDIDFRAVQTADAQEQIDGMGSTSSERLRMVEAAVEAAAASAGVKIDDLRQQVSALGSGAHTTPSR
jgi:phage-related minor tail protein